MNKKMMTIVMVILAVLPVVLLAVLYTALPDQVPLQWGLDGAVSYGDKAQMWLIALMSIFLLILLKVLPKIDPRKQNYQRFQGYYDAFCLVMMVFLLGLNGLVLSESLWPGRVSVSKVVIMAVGVLFVFLGNLMPKVKNNFFMGIRTPWTLSDPDVWNRANRLGGQCFFICGLALVAGGLLLGDLANFILTLVGVAVAALVPVVMSYIWYQKKQKSPMDKGDSQ